MNTNDLYAITKARFIESPLNAFAKECECDLEALKNSTKNDFEFNNKIQNELKFINETGKTEILFTIIKLLTLCDKASYKLRDYLANSLILEAFNLAETNNNQIKESAYPETTNTFTIDFSPLGLAQAENILLKLVKPLKVYRPTYNLKELDFNDLKSELKKRQITYNFFESSESRKLLRYFQGKNKSRDYYSELNKLSLNEIEIVQSIVDNLTITYKCPLSGYRFICDSKIEEYFPKLNDENENDNIQTLQIDFSELGELEKFGFSFGLEI